MFIIDNQVLTENLIKIQRFYLLRTKNAECHHTFGVCRYGGERIRDHVKLKILKIKTMGKVKNNYVTQGFSGKFGEDIISSFFVR
jgi:hypothetical protein